MGRQRIHTGRDLARDLLFGLASRGGRDLQDARLHYAPSVTSIAPITADVKMQRFSLANWLSNLSSAM